MKATPLFSMVSFALWMLIALSCSKSDEDDERYIRKALVVDAGSDTTIYMPFSSYTLDGTKSSNDAGLTYSWSKISGPYVDITHANRLKALVQGMVVPGLYIFQLSIRMPFAAAIHDTIFINVAELICDTDVKEVILTDLNWDYSWIMEIAIGDIFSYIPPNTNLKNLYIRRDSSAVWELIVPLNLNSPDYGMKHEWSFGNGIAVIFPPTAKMDHDTPDLKLEYCISASD